MGKQVAAGFAKTARKLAFIYNISRFVKQIEQLRAQDIKFYLKSSKLYLCASGRLEISNILRCTSAKLPTYSTFKEKEETYILSTYPLKEW